VEVTATSDDGSTSTETFTIAITDDNTEADVSAVTDTDVATNEINENAVGGDPVGITGFATDADHTDEISYSLSDDAGGRFTIDPQTGVVTVNNPALLNYEDNTSHDIEVTATSTDGTTSTETFTIEILDNDEFDVSVISDEDATDNEVTEDASIGDPVGITTLATDDDGTDEVTYSLSDDAGGRFDIDPNTGVITVLAPNLLDYETETSHDVEVTATSTDGSVSTEIFTIELIDADEFDVGAISDTNGTDNEISENPSAFSPVYITAFAEDLDATDEVSYALTDDYNGAFIIDAQTGVIVVIDGNLLNYEVDNAPTIEVTATSTDGSTSTETFTINLTDEDEFDISTLVDNNPATNEIVETSAVGTPVGITALASDGDGTDDITYSLTNSADGAFQIDPQTGVISVLNQAKINYEVVDPVLEVTVLATSDDGSTSTETFEINIIDDNTEGVISAITDVNSGPNFAVEDSGNGTPVGITAFATDPDGTDDVTYTLSDDAGGRFEIHPSTGVVTVANSVLIDYENDISHDITVLATSDDGTTSTEIFTIDVLDNTSEHGITQVVDSDIIGNMINEHPNIGQLVNITAFAEDLDATDFVIYFLMDDYNGTFQINPNTGVVSVKDPALLDYEINPAPSIIVQATSTDGSSSYATLTILLMDDDEFDITPLVDNDLGANEIMESATIGDEVGVRAFSNDADGSDFVTYELTDDFNGAFEIDENTGVITVLDPFKLNHEVDEVATVEVTATSTDGSTSVETFDINIIDDNSEFLIEPLADDDPADNEVLETAPQGTYVGLTALAEDYDGTDETTYSLSDNANGAFQIDPVTGEVTVLNSANLDYEDNTSVTVEVTAVSDDGSSSVETFTINLTDDKTEDPIGAITDEDATDNEVNESAPAGTPIGITALATDPDGTDETTYSLSDDYNGAFEIDPETGVVTLLDNSVLDYEMDTAPTIEVTATSDDGTTSTEVFTINLTDDKTEDPIGAITDEDATDNEVNESAPANTSVGITGLATDPDGTDETTYSLSDDYNGAFQIDSQTGVITVLNSGVLDLETDPTPTVEVTATSDDGTTSTETFAINLLDDIFEFAMGDVTDSDPTDNVINENDPANTPVGVTALAEDADETDETTYSLSDDYNGAFQIDPQTGEITILDNTVLDYETDTAPTLEAVSLYTSDAADDQAPV
jgi:hypothetical protein